MRLIRAFSLFCFFILIVASPLSAHPNHAHGQLPHVQSFGFLAGFVHPWTGLDHFLAMVAVGILSSQAGGRSLWLGPASFLAGVAMGELPGLAHVGIPSIELLVAFSLILVGLILTSKKNPRQIFLFPAFVVFGFVHGHAHGIEIPGAFHAVAYLVGFLAGSTMLHVVGIIFGLLFKKSREAIWANPIRLSGVAIAFTGLFLIVNGQ